MAPTRGEPLGEVTLESEDDSDIQEVVVVQPGKSNEGKRSSPVLKRRRSSPGLDPIPSYTPTPLHILEQRARQIRPANEDYAHYSSNSEDASNYYSQYSVNNAEDEYVPLLQPSPHVIGCDTSNDYAVRTQNTYRQLERNSAISSSRTQSASRRKVSSSSTPRPVSSALAQAVNRRRNSLAQQQELNQRNSASKMLDFDRQSSQHSSNLIEHTQEPVMWSPKVPVEPVVKPSKNTEPISIEDYSKYQSVRPAKQRVAHRPPTIPKNKNNRPRIPIGESRKVPIGFRAKYLDVIINEYLNTGHKEDESYEKGLNEEKALADRALSKMTYVNLVAGLKRRLREQAGVSTLPPDEDPKFVNGNKVVSHEEILTGKVRGTFSIERKRKISDPSELNEQELYVRLSRYVMAENDLVPYGYPYRDPDNPELRMAPLGKDGQKLALRAELAPSYTCERCAKVYRVAESGMPLSTTGKCIFHPGHLWNVRISRALEKRYSCCKGDPSAGGCSSNAYHVHKGELELENYLGYVETSSKPDRDPDKHGIYALDCEMCYTTFGLELTRITVINYKHDVIYEKMVKPRNPILDYNTKFSGIKADDLADVDTTLADVQQDLLKIFSDQTILIGHSLDSDMKALKIFHKRFIDTAQLFPHKKGLPFKRALRTLMIENLSMIIQEDAGHDSKEDASAAFKLVMWKAKTDVPAKAT